MARYSLVPVLKPPPFSSSESTVCAPLTTTRSVAVADVNDDGRPDLVVANETAKRMSVLLGVGDGSFGSPRTSALATYSQVVAVSDVTGDGDAEPGPGYS